MSAWYLEVLERESVLTSTCEQTESQETSNKGICLVISILILMKLVIKATLFGIFTRYPDGAYLSFVCFNGPYDWVLCLRKDNDSGVPPFHVGENDASCNPCFPQLVPRIFASSSGDPVFSYKIAHSAFLRHESEGSTLQRTDIIVQEELFSLILFL